MEFIGAEVFRQRDVMLRRAYHESGHCVAALVCNIPIIAVTIAADVPHMHRGRYRADSDMALGNMVTLCLCGPASEELFCGPITDNSDRRASYWNASCEPARSQSKCSNSRHLFGL
jgi:hypothetical protein